MDVEVEDNVLVEDSGLESFCWPSISAVPSSVNADPLELLTEVAREAIEAIVVVVWEVVV